MRRYILILLLLLPACFSSKPSADMQRPGYGDSIAMLYGRWSFVAERDAEADIRGWFVLNEDPDSHRFIVPNTPIDSLVYNSDPRLQGDHFVWEGELNSGYGRGDFRIDATLNGDTLRGTNDVPRAGKYRFVAVREK